MKFSIEPGQLAEGVRVASTTLPGRPNPPVLGGMLITAAIGSITLATYDHERSTTVTLTADVTEPDTAVVSGKLLVAITKVLPRRATLDIATAGNELTITSGRTVFRLPLMNAGDYPALPTHTTDNVIGEINARELVEALNAVTPFSDQSVGLESLSGVRIENNGADSILTFVATDRYVLSVRDVEWRPKPGAAAITLNIAAPALSAARTAVAPNPGEDDTVHLLWDGSLFGLTTRDVAVTVRSLAHDFIKWRNLLPASYITSTVVDIAEIKAALRRAEVVTGTHPIMFVTFGADGLDTEIDGTNGTVVDQADVITHHGDPVRTCVNATKLRTALDAVPSSTATIGLIKRGRGYLYGIHPDAQAPDDGDGAIARPNTAAVLVVVGVGMNDA